MTLKRRTLSTCRQRETTLKPESPMLKQFPHFTCNGGLNSIVALY